MVKPALYKSHLYNHLNNGANPPKSSKWIANDYIPSTRIFVTEQSTSAEKTFPRGDRCLWLSPGFSAVLAKINCWLPSGNSSWIQKK